MADPRTGGDRGSTGCVRRRGGTNNLLPGLVKQIGQLFDTTICTTNCARSATERMVTAIVDSLGECTAGRRAFPGPAAMASAGDAFYREVARAGYRGAYLLKLAEDVASGRIDLVPRRPDDPGR